MDLRERIQYCTVDVLNAGITYTSKNFHQFGISNLLPKL